MRDNNLKTCIKSRIQYTLDLQNKLNQSIDQNWTQKEEEDFHWRCDCIVEIGELIASTGYKHWKKESCDLKNIKMEAIDVYHFFISRLIHENETLHLNQDIAEILSKVFEKQFLKNSFIFKNYWDLNTDSKEDEKRFRYELIDLCEKFLIKQKKGTLAFNSAAKSLVKIISFIFKDFDEFYNLYIIKNALNIVRQKKGYKQGTYIKLWDGIREDNEIAIEIIEKDSKYADSIDILVEKLLNTYEEHINK